MGSTMPGMTQIGTDWRVVPQRMSDGRLGSRQIRASVAALHAADQGESPIAFARFNHRLDQHCSPDRLAVAIRFFIGWCTDVDADADGSRRQDRERRCLGR